MLSLKESSGSWVFIFAVSALQLGQNVHEEFVVDGVTFVTVRRLARVRLRLGLPYTVGELKRRFPGGSFLDRPDQVVAVLRRSGRPVDIELTARRRVTEALDILSASQLGYARRRTNAAPSVDGETAQRTSHFYIDTKTGHGVQSAQLAGKLGELSIERRWLNYQKRGFFWSLLQVIDGRTQAAPSWRSTLRRVAVLIGQSQKSTNAVHAFLLNMIAIEALLAHGGDKYFDALPDRTEAIIGWVGFWHTHGYGQRIRDLYKKRCQYVHEGDGSAVAVEDLLFTDDILFNLLVNILGHPTLFSSKDDLVRFADRVAAERVLGITKSQVRPKTLRFISRKYSADDLKRI